MEIRNLQTFLLLSECKNFTKTASQLGYSQSTISTHIKQLEEELQVPLFERIGKRVYLTSDGERLVIYAKKIVSLEKEMLTSFTTETNKSITIGVVESLCIYYLPKYIEEFHKQYPRIDMYIKIMNTEQAIMELSNNTIDLAFILETDIKDSSIITAFKQKESFGLYASPKHPLTTKTKIKITAFLNISLLLTGSTCPYRKPFEQLLLQHQIPPKIVLECDSIPAIKETTIINIGICILPSFAVKKELASKKLVAINFSYKPNVYSQLLHHKDKWLTPELKSFIDSINTTIIY